MAKKNNTKIECSTSKEEVKGKKEEDPVVVDWMEKFIAVEVELQSLFKFYNSYVKIGYEEQTKKQLHHHFEILERVTNPIVDKQQFIEMYTTLGYEFNYSPQPGLSILDVYAAEASKYHGSTGELERLRHRNCVNMLKMFEVELSKDIRSPWPLADGAAGVPTLTPRFEKEKEKEKEEKKKKKKKKKKKDKKKEKKKQKREEEEKKKDEEKEEKEKEKEEEEKEEEEKEKDEKKVEKDEEKKINMFEDLNDEAPPAIFTEVY